MTQRTGSLTRLRHHEHLLQLRQKLRRQQRRQQRLRQRVQPHTRNKQTITALVIGLACRVREFLNVASSVTRDSRGAAADDKYKNL